MASPIIEQLLVDIRAGRINNDDVANLSRACIERLKNIQLDRAGAHRVGDTVALNNKVRPVYLRGALATITSIQQSWCHINLLVPISGPQGKSWHRNIRCPLTSLDPHKSPQSAVNEG